MSEVLLPPSVPRFCDHAATLRRIWVWTEPGSSAPLPPPHLSLPAVTSSRSLRPPEQRRRGSTREGRQRGQTKGASLSQGQPGAHGLLPARRGRTCRGSPALQHCGPGLRQPLLRREQSRTAAARTHRGATGGLPPPGGPRRPKNDRNGPIRAAAPGPPGCPAQPPPPSLPRPPSPSPGSETATSDRARGCQPLSRPYSHSGTGPEGGTPLRARHGEGNPGERRPEPGGRPAAPRRRARSPRPRAQSPAGRPRPPPSRAPRPRRPHPFARRPIPTPPPPPTPETAPAPRYRMAALRAGGRGAARPPAAAPPEEPGSAGP